MSEIQFLITLLTDHKLPPSVKKLCLTRIGEVEASLASQSPHKAPVSTSPLERGPLPQRVENTELAAKRQQLIDAAMNGRPMTETTGKGISGPRKF